MRIFDHTLFINMKKILAASSACRRPEKLNAAQHSESCDISSDQIRTFYLLKVGSKILINS